MDINLAGFVNSMREVLKGNVLILTLGTVLRQLSLFMTFPFFSLYVRALGGSMVDIGVVNSFRPLASMFIYPIAGILAVRYNRVKILIYVGIVNALLYFVYMSAPDWRYLAAANFLNGILVFRFPASSSLLADSMDSKLRGSGYAAIYALPGFIGIVTPYIGGYLMTVFDIELGMKILYGWTIIIVLFIAFLNGRYLEEPRNIVSKSSLKIFETISIAYRSIWNTIRWMPRELRFYAVMIILNIFFSAVTGPFWIIYATEVIGISKLDWGGILTLTTVIRVILSAYAGALIDKYEKRKIVAGALALSVIPVMVFPYCNSLITTLLLFIPIAVSNAFLMPVAGALMADLVPPERRGMVMAAIGRGSLLLNFRGGSGGGPTMGFLLTLPVIVGSLAGGYMYNFSPNITWFILGCAVLLNSLIAIFLLKKSSKE